MDWFKRKNNAGNPNPATPTSPTSSHPSSPTKDTTDAPIATDQSNSKPTAEELLEQYKQESAETFKEYDRKLESLALILFEKSEENDSMHNQLQMRDQDMKVLLEKLEQAESQISTYKENQTEYKRRLDVLTDCLEDLARENMKLAAKGALPSMPEDYEEERFPTPEQVHKEQMKSNAAAEIAVKIIPPKIGQKSNSKSSGITTTQKEPTKSIPAQTTPKSNTPPTTPAITKTTSESSSSLDDSTEPSAPEKSSEPALSKKNSRLSNPNGGLVLPQKSKSKVDLSTTSHKEKTSSNQTSHKEHSETSSKRSRNNENEFVNMANDPQALMAVLKKYKAQADSLRRELIRSQQKCESLQQSIDKYESKMVKADKKFRDSLLKEAKRRKDAEYIANVLKKRVGELQFLLDEKDDSDEDSDSDDETTGNDQDKKDDDEDDGFNPDEVDEN